VQADVLGRGKLVRCAMCGATWQQSAVDESGTGRQRVLDLIKWTFFWFAVFVSIFSLFFARNAVVKIWPHVADFYEFVGVQNESKGAFSIQNMSNFFIMKDDTLYMGLKGELVNISDEVQTVPGITISLRNEENSENCPRYRKMWSHNLTYKKLLPNQKIVFETELQSVPHNNLICDIKLDIL
jgi:hypothetical protein